MIKNLNLKNCLAASTSIIFAFTLCSPAQAQIHGGIEAPKTQLKLKMSSQAEALLIENMKIIDAELGLSDKNAVVNMSFLSTDDIKSIGALPKKEQFVAILEAYRNSRIYGGLNANLKQFPWQVFIKMRSSEGTFQCGGSVLDNQHILTAAHCLYDTAGNQFSTNNITVMYDDVEIAWMTSIQVARAVHHPDYDDKINSYDNDIAILRLERPLGFTANTSAVKLPLYNSLELQSGTDVTVSGFGKTELGYTSQNLLYADVKYITKSDCKNNSDYEPYELYPSMLCAGLPGGNVDACSGDSGGPLVLKDSDILVGVVSWGQGCGLKNYPGVYTDVSKFVPWIQQMLAAP